MKRVKCPKCDHYIVFDETLYKDGQALVFRCENCKKEFGVRIGVHKLNDIHEETNIDEHQFDQQWGSVVVVENKFAYKQIIPLELGDNVFGRYLKGNSINKPIFTSDPSIDTLHCIINVSIGKDNKVVYTIKDAPSNTGTFCMNNILGINEKRVIHDGEIINIGATTMILYAANKLNSDK